MRILTFLALFLSLNPIYGQDKKFDLGISVFPNYSFGLISDDGNSSGSTDKGAPFFETWKPSISSNLFVEYNLNAKSSIGFGLGYQNNGEKTRKIDLIYGVDPQTGEPIIDPSQPTHARFTYIHHNIELPIYYKNQFGEKFYFLAGASGIINVSNRISSERFYSDGSSTTKNEEDQSTDFRRFIVSVNVGCGMNYFSNDKFTLFVHPYVQTGLMGVSKSASLNRSLLSLGISTGIHF